MRSIELWTSSRFLVLGICAALGGAAGLAGCSSIEPIAPQDQTITDPAQLYMRLTLDHPAVNLSTAPGSNTLQLTAMPRDALGGAMSGLPAPTFTSLDTTKVRVAAGGVVTAVGTGTEIKVIASLTVGPVTHADTAWINVSTPAILPVLDTLSIRPPPSDSTAWAVGSGFSFTDGALGFALYFLGLSPDPKVTARTVTPAGTAIPGLQVEYRSLDRTIATVERRTGAVKPLVPGQVRMVAQTMAYGIARADTVVFTVTPKILGQVNWGLDFDGSGGAPFPRLPQEVRIAPYGVVGFYNSDTASSVGATFDDPTNVMAPSGGLSVLCLPSFWGTGPEDCGTGNVVLGPGSRSSSGFAVATVQIRQFPMPGVYSFQYTKAGVVTGLRGRIVVSNTYE